MSVSKGQDALPALPSNVEAEAALLGALMMPEMGWLIEHAADRLNSAAFYEPVHGRIFDAIQRQHSVGQPANPIFIKGYFDGDDGIAVLGGANKYLSGLTANMEGLLAPRQFVEQVADLAARRKVMTAMLGAIHQCADANMNLKEVVAGLDSAVDQRASDAVTVSDAAESVAAFQSELDAEHFGVLNNRISAIDGLLGPLEPKSLTILSARTGMGKTVVATNYALGAAMAGHGVCFVSLEMSRAQLMGRMIADAGFDDADRRVSYTDIQKRSLNPWQRERVNDLGKLIGKLPLTIVDPGTMTIGQLERTVRSQKRAMAARAVSLDLVVVDYLQLLRSDGPKRSIYEAISDISIRLKGLAKDNGVAVLALAQLSRNVDNRPGNRPILADLRDSGQIEQDADAVLFLLREEYYVRNEEPKNKPDEYDAWETKINRCRGVIEFIVPKRRNGSPGSSQGKFFAPYQAVRDQ
ncbi:hypothetical protein V474_22790 [Novosphingobium barchaimii LL02]|uniref:DNA 5'-3' helicase n=1 Tax=Novosphingobium barchaimii LL02 TaxID=1114963 RepID=A0A0J8AFE7_9SPHN|nr:DnaB-like helicase C-terminal domain-containing protein [Novosphingobium barchaimii]KMS53610.1 hypothetical protein V474_22790 [Novosphingobium barchaimii LL02]